MFDYTFGLEFGDGTKMNHVIKANSYASAWVGMGLEASEMPDIPVAIRWIKVS